MAEIRDVNDRSFDEEVLADPLPVLVDFWADDCPSCRALSPTLRDLAKDYSDQIHILKLNVDENPAITARYGIRAMPTVLGFREGTLQGKVVGAQARPEFEALVQLLL